MLSPHGNLTRSHLPPADWEPVVGAIDFPLFASHRMVGRLARTSDRSISAAGVSLLRAAERKDARKRGAEAEEQRIVGVRLEDLCKIADAVDSMKGDLNNGKWKYLEFEIDSIHEIVERWAADEAVLGGGCHDDHRCGPCRDLPTSFHARFVSRPGMIAESLGNRDSQTGIAETSEVNVQSDPVSGAQAHRVPQANASDASVPRMPAEMLKRRYLNNDDVESLLFPVSDFVIQVMYRDQTGYFGVVAGWCKRRR